MTLAVVASCTKTEISYDAPSHISIAPVAKVNTKASLEGTYPTNLPLYVYANAGDPSAEESAYTAKYFENYKFEYDGTSSFVNANAYWPNEKYLVFAGVSASGNIGAAQTPATLSMDFANDKLTVAGYIQPFGAADVNNDLLWFPRTGKTGKPANNASINPTMHHACALLKFNFIAEAGLKDVKIKEIVVNDLYWSGTAVCGTSSAEWTITTGATVSPVTVYTRAEETAETTDEQKAVYTLKVKGTESPDVYRTPETVSNNTIVIPQTPTELSITYDFTTSAGQVLRETVKVPLSIGTEKKTVDGVEKDVAIEWQSGKRYIYNITMGADQIKIAPTVKAWDDETFPAHN